MNSKRILAVACTLCLLVSAAIAVCAAALTRHFDALERASATARMEQHQQTLAAQASQLRQRAQSYAQAAQAASITLPDSPLTDSPLAASPLDWRVDVLAIVDAQGRDVQSQQIDPVRQMPVPFSPSLRAQLLRLWSELKSSGAPLQSGWLNTERGLLAICALEIATSQPGEPALMVMGRYAEVPKSLSILPLDAPGRTPELAPEVAVWLHRAATGSSLIVDDARTHTSTAHAVLRDVAGRAVTLVRTSSTGELSIGGRRTTWLLMGSLVLVLGAASFVLIILILRMQAGSATGDSEVSHNALRHLQEGVALIDAGDGSVVDANEAWLRTLDYEREELAALSLRGIYLDLPDQLRPVCNGTLVECRMRARNGRLIDAELTLAEINEGGRTLLGIVGRDISQRKQAEQSLAENASLFEHLCTHDALTELPNQMYLQTHLPSLLQEVADEQRVLGLLYLQVGFAQQRAPGRSGSDAVLKLLAARLRSELSADQLLIRMEGTEFVVAAAVQAVRDIDALATRLLECIAKPLLHEGGLVAMTASIGVAAYPQHGLDGDALLKHADVALYKASQEAKQHKRNGYCWFVDDMNLQESERVILEQALRRAIDTDQIQLEYQPIVDLHTGLVTSFEALARWRHPQLGTVPPQRFIPVAERSRLIVPLGEQIVRLAILQLHDWQAAGLPLVPVAINVTALQLEVTELAAYLDELVRRYQVDLKWLAFEVTEAVWLKDPTTQLTTLQQLRSAGSRIYMDDCHARLPDPERLRTLPVDAVKLDQALIRAELAGLDSSKVLAQTVALAEQLNLATVAEGVETAEQAEQLRRLGFRCGQGYYFSKPIPPLQCRSLLQHMGEARRMTETVKVRAFRAPRPSAATQ